MKPRGIKRPLSPPPLRTPLISNPELYTLPPGVTIAALRVARSPLLSTICPMLVR